MHKKEWVLGKDIQSFHYLQNLRKITQMIYKRAFYPILRCCVNGINFTVEDTLLVSFVCKSFHRFLQTLIKNQILNMIPTNDAPSIIKLRELIEFHYICLHDLLLLKERIQYCLPKLRCIPNCTHGRILPALLKAIKGKDFIIFPRHNQMEILLCPICYEEHVAEHTQILVENSLALSLGEYVVKGWYLHLDNEQISELSNLMSFFYENSYSKWQLFHSAIQKTEIPFQRLFDSIGSIIKIIEKNSIFVNDSNIHYLFGLFPSCTPVEKNAVDVDLFICSHFIDLKELARLQRMYPHLPCYELTAMTQRHFDNFPFYDSFYKITPNDLESRKQYIVDCLESDYKLGMSNYKNILSSVEEMKYINTEFKSFVHRYVLYSNCRSFHLDQLCVLKNIENFPIHQTEIALLSFFSAEQISEIAKTVFPSLLQHQRQHQNINHINHTKISQCVVTIAKLFLVPPQEIQNVYQTLTDGSAFVD